MTENVIHPRRSPDGWPADLVYDAVTLLRLTPGATPAGGAIANLLEHLADEMSDEHAREVEHPAHIASRRWLVHADLGHDEASHDSWMAALALARELFGLPDPNAGEVVEVATADVDLVESTGAALRRLGGALVELENGLGDRGFGPDPGEMNTPDALVRRALAVVDRLAGDDRPACSGATSEAPIWRKARQHANSERWMITCNEGPEISIVFTDMPEGMADWMLTILGRQPYAPGHRDAIERAGRERIVAAQSVFEENQSLRARLRRSNISSRANLVAADHRYAVLSRLVEAVDQHTSVLEDGFLVVLKAAREALRRDVESYVPADDLAWYNAGAYAVTAKPAADADMQSLDPPAGWAYMARVDQLLKLLGSGGAVDVEALEQAMARVRVAASQLTSAGGGDGSGLLDLVVAHGDVRYAEGGGADGDVTALQEDAAKLIGEIRDRLGGAVVGADATETGGHLVYIDSAQGAVVLRCTNHPSWTPDVTGDFVFTVAAKSREHLGVQLAQEARRG